MPSGATANAGTAPVWPVRVWRACPVCGSQIRTVAVVAGGGQPGAVRGDRQRRHRAGVAGEGVAGLPGVRVPDPHRLVVAGGGQPGAVRGDRQRRHRVGVAGEGVAGLPGVRVPDPHRRRRRRRRPARSRPGRPPAPPPRRCGRSGRAAARRAAGPAAGPGRAGGGRSMVARICSRSSSRPVWSGSREANVAASDPGGSSGPSRWAFCRTTIASARAVGRSDSRRSDSSPAGPDPLQLVDQPPRVGQHRLQLVAPTRPAQVRRQPRPQVRLARRAGRPTRRRAAAGPGGRRPPPRPTRPAAPGWCRAGRRGSRRAAPAGRGCAGSRPAARGRTAADTTAGPETASSRRCVPTAGPPPRRGSRRPRRTPPAPGTGPARPGSTGAG